MHLFSSLLLLGGCISICLAREPFRPRGGTLPFLVYFSSRHRGLCVGSLVSRTAVLTAAVCVTNAQSATPDTRPINVITGTTYRHPRRGIRVQVTKILIPNLSNMTGNRVYLMQKSAAVLLLKRRIPDILAEVPLRPIGVDYTDEIQLGLQEECFMPGWHFFYKGDKIYPVNKFLLQRRARVQFLSISKMNIYCDALNIKFQKALTDMGYYGYYDYHGKICIRDPERIAQPCHGMYGAPLVCQGKAVAMLMAPDAQWTSCTGFSNIVHSFSSQYLSSFMRCVSKLFAPELTTEWNTMKKSLYDDLDHGNYDYLPAMYDKLIFDGDLTSEEYTR